jgi:HAD superfamily phosphoserine phosphatase-like hydrolase
MRTSGAHTFHPAARQFLESVLRLTPKVAAFDCDGTLWSGDAGEAFFDWEIKNGVVNEEVGRRMRARYADYRAGRLSEEDMCGEMVTMHKGISEATMTQTAAGFMERVFSGEIFPEMLELMRRLRDRGCEVWAVSASNEWVIRAGMKQFGVGEDRILASRVELDDGIVTDRLVRVPSGAGKTRALRGVVKKEIDAAFGNSRFDTEMLAMAKHPFAINPNADLEAAARGRGWPIYFPGGTR